MSKHEKHARAAARQERDVQAKQTDDEVLDELEGSEELLKTSFTAGNEMKIAVAVISVLLVVFAAAVVKWMRHSSGSASNSTEEAVANRDDRPTADGIKGKLERQEKSPFGSSATSAKPTVVPAVPGTGSDLKPKMRAGESDTWAFGSDSKLKPARAQDDRESTSPFRPRTGPGDSGTSHGLSADRNSPKPSFGSWEHDRDARTPAAGQQPSDPFRSRPAVDGLRRDGLGTTAIPSAPNALSAGASKDLSRTDVGRIGNPSYALTDASRTMPRFGASSLPSAASRAPGSAADSSPLRSPDFSVPGPAPASSSISSPRSTGLGQGSLGPANADGRRADGTYVVQFDDNFWSISQKLFGTGGYFQALAKHNAKKYPSEDKLRAGDVILAPSAAELEKLYPQLCPSPARRSPADSQPRTASVPARSDGRRTYVVQEGDTLYDIARRELGKAARWSEIYDLNKDLVSRHWLDLAPGTQILLPDAGPGSVSQRPGVGSLR